MLIVLDVVCVWRPANRSTEFQNSRNRRVVINMITLENVSKYFRRTKVLDDLTLTFGVGDRVALVGSNGAGKTTLIRCILGQYVHQGRVMVNDVEPRSNRETVLKSIGFVPQIAPPLKMPVGELLRFSAGTADISIKDIEAIGQRLDIDFGELRKRPFVKLSGGQKQKILVSIAMPRKPQLIIMDEPTANLDPQARQTLLTCCLSVVNFLFLSRRIDWKRSQALLTASLNLTVAVWCLTMRWQIAVILLNGFPVVSYWRGQIELLHARWLNGSLPETRMV